MYLIYSQGKVFIDITNLTHTSGFRQNSVKNVTLHVSFKFFFPSV